jgi:uridine kinase
MSFVFHHLIKFGYANLDLIEEIEETQNKAVVLISGASSSGKSFAANYLRGLLNQNKHKAVVLSLDQYDFGLSGIIPNKVNLNYFNNSLPNIKEIESRIKKIIYNVPFDKKFSPEILKTIELKIRDLLHAKDVPVFISGLAKEWQKLNFDEPSVYDLKEASDDLKLLLQGKKVKAKLYSKVISEQVPSHHVIDGSKYDVIIVEGIYALDPLLLNELKGYPLVTNFIDGNPKSLFLRRIIRDAKLTSADNVFTINLYFKYIVNAYLTTILPSRKNADVVLNNDMSFGELRAGDLYVTKEEIHTENPKVIEYLKRFGRQEKSIYQKDYYLNAPNENLDFNNILRFRLISNDGGKTYKPSSLVHKGAPKVRKDNKIIRPINVLLKEGELVKVWKNEKACLNDFMFAGFLVGKIEKKIKTKLTYNGQSLTIREVEGEGSYIEFNKPLLPNVVKEIKKKVSKENA